MPLPTITGSKSIDRRACEYFWIYTESTSVAGVSVSIDGGATITAASGTDPHGVTGWRYLVAGADCPAPGAATVLAVGQHQVRAWQTDAPETHAYTGSIRIT